MRKGFTLVEMLVAVLLVSMLIATAMYSFKFLISTLKKTNFTGIEKVIKYNQLVTSIESMKYYVTDKYDIFHNPMKDLHFYFYGTKNEANYITENPSFSSEIAVVKLLCEKDKFLYIEEPLYERIDYLSPKVLDNSKKTILFDKIEDCKLSYIYNKKVFSSLNEKIPEDIILSYKKVKKKYEIYVKIKSDFNLSLGLIKDVLYEE